MGWVAVGWGSCPTGDALADAVAIEQRHHADLDPECPAALRLGRPRHLDGTKEMINPVYSTCIPSLWLRFAPAASARRSPWRCPPPPWSAREPACRPVSHGRMLLAAAWPARGQGLAAHRCSPAHGTGPPAAPIAGRKVAAACRVLAARIPPSSSGRRPTSGCMPRRAFMLAGGLQGLLPFSRKKGLAASWPQPRLERAASAPGDRMCRASVRLVVETRGAWRGEARRAGPPRASGKRPRSGSSVCVHTHGSIRLQPADMR